MALKTGLLVSCLEKREILGECGGPGMQARRGRGQSGGSGGQGGGAARLTLIHGRRGETKGRGKRSVLSWAREPRTPHAFPTGAAGRWLARPQLPLPLAVPAGAEAGGPGGPERNAAPGRAEGRTHRSRSRRPAAPADTEALLGLAGPLGAAGTRAQGGGRSPSRPPHGTSRGVLPSEQANNLALLDCHTLSSFIYLFFLAHLTTCNDRF